MYLKNKLKLETYYLFSHSTRSQKRIYLYINNMQQYYYLFADAVHLALLAFLLLIKLVLLHSLN